MDPPDRRHGIQRPIDISLSAMSRSRPSSVSAGWPVSMSWRRTRQSRPRVIRLQEPKAEGPVAHRDH
jgi:ABC-type uncharacterized transport system YnjBCD ATPase subunit